ncbi:Kinesin-like protein KIN-12F [Frankliniella fusca]|uniref:Kinesin-like protein KIN-12F n=1 Tax=Frankliniella fusca TaxID=407009 RepID=A0AAE1GT62_9NEOP|nr:Kinesin-like protein KIN-12F [Frankliniella fusca]
MFLIFFTDFVERFGPGCAVPQVHPHCLLCPPRGLLTKQIGAPLHELYPVDCAQYPAPRRRASLLAARERPPGATGPERAVKTGVRVRGAMQPTAEHIQELSGRVTPTGPGGFRSPAVSRPQSADREKDGERQRGGRPPPPAEARAGSPPGEAGVEGAAEGPPGGQEEDAAAAGEVPADEQTLSTLAVEEPEEAVKAGSRTSLRRSRSPSHLSDRGSPRRQRSADRSGAGEAGDTEDAGGRRSPRAGAGAGLYVGTDPCAVSATYRSSGASEQPKPPGADPCAVSDTYRPSDAVERGSAALGADVYMGKDPCAVSDTYRPSEVGAVEGEAGTAGGVGVGVGVYTGTDPCAVSATYRSSAGSAYPAGLTVPGTVAPLGEGIPEGVSEDVPTAVQEGVPEDVHVEVPESIADGEARAVPVTPPQANTASAPGAAVDTAAPESEPKRTSVAGVLASDPSAVPPARRLPDAAQPAGGGPLVQDPGPPADAPQESAAAAAAPPADASPWPPGISGQGSPACRSSGNIQAPGAPGTAGPAAPPTTRATGAKTMSAPPSSMSLSRGPGAGVGARGPPVVPGEDQHHPTAASLEAAGAEGATGAAGAWAVGLSGAGSPACRSSSSLVAERRSAPRVLQQSDAGGGRRLSAKPEDPAEGPAEAQ